ncbi:PREDICTED: multidrug resistance-associated protein 4-like [Amphimedon queenslandica]|uniref:ABC transmembrane type-1 domain-containing protein n=1 Tax=Amphimedon queenslandica TaxID=400682 RepID=A0AAN0JU06_AMPQE|nr:PREDICTED: multidrug resistance-associated protein 4-like [Amphimedon queenslandica]|eukprot:XP_019860364.1 PREDICTED: multidrug resistance-associated protein 4-like [Amphimedon queenslandica]
MTSSQANGGTSKWTPQLAAHDGKKDYRRKVKYNPLCRAFFCWVDPLFWLGCGRSLEFSDLYAHPPEADSKYLLEKFNKYWSVELQRRREGRSPRLLLVWVKIFWWRVLFQGLLVFLQICCMAGVAEILGYITDYFVIESPTAADTRNAYLYAVGLGLVSLCIMLCHAMCFHIATLLGMYTRIIMTAASYNKILSLSQTAIGQLTVGHIVNLASNDVHKFDQAFLMYHYLWIGPLHVILTTYLMFLEVQWSAFIATALLVLQIPLQSVLAKVFTKIKLKAARLTDKRVKVMNEVISGIRVIKMYAWEYAFSDVVAAIRKSEIYKLLQFFAFFSVSSLYEAISRTTIMFLVFSVYVNISEEELTPRKVFVSLSLIQFVRLTSIRFLIICIQLLSNGRVAWIRIKNLLLMDDYWTNNIQEYQNINNSEDPTVICLQPMPSDSGANEVIVEDLTASWSMDENKLSLSNISFTVNKEKPLLAVVGKVGCGKSTLLQCLLKELPALSGTAMVKGSIGYASQEAWVFSATLRDNNKIVILVTHQVQYLERCDAILGLNEGRVLVYGNARDVLKEDSGIFELLVDDTSTSDDGFKIRKQSISTGLEPQIAVEFSQKLETVEEEDDNEKPQKPESMPAEEPEVTHKLSVPAEERAHGNISVKTYFNYFLAGGGYIFTIFVLIIFAITEGNIVTADWWISDWADCESETNLNRSTCFLSDNERIGIYGGLVGSLTIFAALRAMLFFVLMLNASRVVHNRMFARVLRAPVLFFDTNPVGRILNRFSKDVGFLDDRLIISFNDFLSIFTRFLSTMIAATIANVYTLFAVGFVFVAAWTLRFYYLKTARDIKRLEALSRSPIYSHLSLTLQGLPTIRSYSMQSEAMNHFHTFQNQNTQAAYLYAVTERWFGMRIDSITSIFITIVALASIPVASTLNAGLIGLSLTYAVTLMGAFQYCIRQSAEVESLMVSAERVMAYGRLETEPSLETDPSISLSSDWPTKGHIELNNLSYRHSNEGPLVLRGITCNIKPSEKIGIVGRTGAGKSSLIGALFRLAEPTGSIKIDGVETTQLGLHDVRSNMSIIPQDPVLFGASVRYNLDPFQQYDDDRIWRMIREQFSDYTVLTIAHRLDTVMDSDRIMILKSGKLIEFDVPHILLSQSSSYLSKLVEQTGPNNAERLRNIALESYNKLN